MQKPALLSSGTPGLSAVANGIGAGGAAKPPEALRRPSDQENIRKHMWVAA